MSSIISPVNIYGDIPKVLENVHNKRMEEKKGA